MQPGRPVPPIRRAKAPAPRRRWRSPASGPAPEPVVAAEPVRLASEPLAVAAAAWLPPCLCRQAVRPSGSVAKSSLQLGAFGTAGTRALQELRRA